MKNIRNNRLENYRETRETHRVLSFLFLKLFGRFDFSLLLNIFGEVRHEVLLPQAEAVLPDLVDVFAGVDPERHYVHGHVEVEVRVRVLSVLGNLVLGGVIEGRVGGSGSEVIRDWPSRACTPEGRGAAGRVLVDEPDGGLGLLGLLLVLLGLGGLVRLPTELFFQFYGLQELGLRN